MAGGQVGTPHNLRTTDNEPGEGGQGTGFILDR